MTGVEILAMEEVVVVTQFNWTMFWIIFCGVLVIMFIIGTAMSIDNRDWFQLLMMLCFSIFIVGPIFGALFGSLAATPIEYETQYKVTISDEVSMNDFLSKYEIIDQEGKIYTVREIND